MFLGHHESTLKIGNMNSISHIVILEYPSWSSKLCRRIRVYIHIHVRVQVGVEVRFGTSVIVSHVVDVEAADIRKEVLVEKRIVGRRDAISSRRSAPQKTDHPHPYRFTRGLVLEAYSPVVWYMPKEGVEKM
jgi:hypothetical protein